MLTYHCRFHTSFITKSGKSPDDNGRAGATGGKTRSRIKRHRQENDAEDALADVIPWEDI
ncbi:hypothetical protein ASD80_15745 [Devosia sp. Root635]|nr:hypothetical protein ASD80_15745 [Devosia sp. Root635]